MSKNYSCCTLWKDYPGYKPTATIVMIIDIVVVVIVVLVVLVVVIVVVGLRPRRRRSCLRDGRGESRRCFRRGHFPGCSD